MLVALPSGRRLLIREIRPDDKQELALAHSRLSPESMRGRFLTPKPRLSARELRYLTELDGSDHYALVAVEAEEPHDLLAVGRYVRLVEDATTAEVAIVVGDHLQGQGLGSRLGLLLADHARCEGIERFSATMLSDNTAAHRLFARISDRLSSARSGAVDEIVAELLAA